MNNKLFIKCEEAQHKCDKAQYKEASFWEKVQLNLHLIICILCRKHTKNNQKLTNLINQKTINLEPFEKSKLRAVFEKELAKQNQ